MAYTPAHDFRTVLYGDQARKSLSELEIPISAQRLEVYDHTYSHLALFQPPSNYPAGPTIMGDSNEQYHYAVPAGNPNDSSNHLSGYMYPSQWHNNAATVTDDVPTISIEPGLSGMYHPEAYSPDIVGPGTPSEEGNQSPVFDYSMWQMPGYQSGAHPAVSPTSYSEAALYTEDGQFSPPLGSSESYLQMPPAPRQRSASEPNLFASIMDTNPATGMFYPDDLTLPSHQQQRMLPQEPVYLSPTSDNTVHAYSPPLGGYPASGSQGLRRAVSMTGGRPHSASDAAFLHPQYALPGDGGRVVRARSLGSSRGGSPYSRAASPSGSELSEGASSFGGYASDAASQASGHIAKQVVTTGPVAEASAIRRTHAAKFECDICGVHLTTKTNLDGHRKSHLGLKEHKCSMCEKYFTRDWDRKRHEKTHAKAELHCQLCGKTSTRKDAFDKHRCRPRDDAFGEGPSGIARR